MAEAKFISGLPALVEEWSKVLAANSEDWKARYKVLERIEKVMGDEGTKYNKAFMTTFVPLFNKYMIKPMEVQIKDLRSEIVRQSATTIGSIAKLLGPEFKKAAVTLLKPLVDCAAQTNKIMRDHCNQCLITVVQYTPLKEVLTPLLELIKSPKSSKPAQQALMNAYRALLTHWPMKKFKPFAAALEEHLSIGLKSAATETRDTAVHCVLAYVGHFPERKEAFYKSIDARAKKLIEKVESGGGSGVDGKSPSGRHSKSPSVDSSAGFSVDAGGSGSGSGSGDEPKADLEATPLPPATGGGSKSAAAPEHTLDVDSLLPPGAPEMRGPQLSMSLLVSDGLKVLDVDDNSTLAGQITPPKTAPGGGGGSGSGSAASTSANGSATSSIPRPRTSLPKAGSAPAKPLSRSNSKGNLLERSGSKSNLSDNKSSASGSSGGGSATKATPPASRIPAPGSKSKLPVRKSLEPELAKAGEPVGPKIGSRVQLDRSGEQKKGTVRWIGKIQDKEFQGEWMGVEMDDSVGDNNGSIDGVSYFVTGPLKAVFMRRHQLKVIDGGGASGGSAHASPTKSRIPAPKSRPVTASPGTASSNGPASEPPSPGGGRSSLGRPASATATPQRSSPAPPLNTSGTGSGAKSASRIPTTRKSVTPTNASGSGTKNRTLPKTWKSSSNLLTGGGVGGSASKPKTGTSQPASPKSAAPPSAAAAQAAPAPATTGGGGGVDASTLLSPQPTATAGGSATAVPVVSGDAKQQSSIPVVEAPSREQLIRDHRKHVSESAKTLQRLSTLLTGWEKNAGYDTDMIELLTKQAKDTERLIANYVAFKKKADAAKAHDDFLSKHSFF